MILITGAAGKTGWAVMRALGGLAEPVRAMVRRPEQGAQFGSLDVVVADLLSERDLERAMRGVRAVYLIAPNVHPQEERIGEIAIAAARSAGVERLVYHSVLHPQTREMPHHWRKLGVEERLFESDIDFTILQPAAYMQNVLAYRDAIVERGVYRVPYGESGALSLVDLDDVAEVAARVLTEDGHGDAVYELAGPAALSPTDIARSLAEVLGRPVEAQAEPLSEWVEQARSIGIDGYALEALTRMFRYYDRHGLRGGSRVLEWLLARPATTFDAFLQRKLRSG
jgi:uncharacterized protein YbjT (DUF2867 family)